MTMRLFVCFETVMDSLSFFSTAVVVSTEIVVLLGVAVMVDSTSSLVVFIKEAAAVVVVCVVVSVEVMKVSFVSTGDERVVVEVVVMKPSGDGIVVGELKVTSSSYDS